MELTSIDQVFASRSLTLINKKSIHSVVVTIGKPQPFPDSSDYYCPYQITGMGDEKINWSGGIDEVQALLLALESIGIYLRHSDEYQKGNLFWIGSENGNLGFPQHDSSGMLTYLIQK